MDNHTAGVDLDKQYWPHGATETACSSCGLTMGESRLLHDLKRGEITLARRAEPSVTEADERALFDGDMQSEYGGNLMTEDLDALWSEAPGYAWRRARAALASPAVPEGYKLVPIEPTLEMLMSADIEVGNGQWDRSQAVVTEDEARAIWKQMIEASPAVSQQAAPEAATADARDAARYRALRAGNDYANDGAPMVLLYERGYDNGDRPYWCISGEVLDNAVDTLISEEQDCVLAGVPYAGLKLKEVSQKALWDSLNELVQAMYAYQKDADDEPTIQHRDMMKRAEALLAAQATYQVVSQKDGAAVEQECKRCGGEEMIYVEDATTPCPDCQDLRDYDEVSPTDVGSNSASPAPLPAQGVGPCDCCAAIREAEDIHGDGPHTAPAQAGDARDAAYFRWLNEDHADAETREKARELARRLGTSSYFAITRDIDAAMSASQGKKGGAA